MQPITALPVCIDEYPDGEQFDPALLPSPVNLRSTSHDELALAKYKLWQPGQTLRISFLNGDKVVQQRVEAHARTWLEHANLQFEFGNYPDAVIRITFHGFGYSSLVGTDALKRAAPLPTMTLSGFTAATDDTEMRRVVLHEFGHALGCVHEQANPTLVIPWNRDKVYSYYAAHGWDEAMVDRNVFLRYTPLEVHHTQHDPSSIMQYPVSKEHTDGKFEVGWNTRLSETDKLFIKAMYP